MLITKREEVTKQGFCAILRRKLRPRGSLLLEFIQSSGCGGGERLFEFDWEEEGVGGYSRWALIRGWALIRINTGICIYRNYGTSSRDIAVFKIVKMFLRLYRCPLKACN